MLDKKIISSEELNKKSDERSKEAQNYIDKDQEGYWTDVNKPKEKENEEGKQINKTPLFPNKKLV